VTHPPRPTHSHTWDRRTVPAWVRPDQHHFSADELVIHTPDGHALTPPGWTLVGWSNGTVTVASPTTTERVYGPSGAFEQLARAEAALTRVAALREDLRGVTGARWIADSLDTILTTPDQL
jgi:hypothetical protein